MSPSNILFIAEGQLGDLLLLTPAIRSVQETFPLARIAVLILERRSICAQDSSIPKPILRTNKGNGPLATNHHIDEIITLDRRALRSLSAFRRIREEVAVGRLLRRKKFDTVICTFPEDRFAWWAFASGARVRVGQHDQPLRFLLTHEVQSKKADRGVLEYYCDLVRSIGSEVRSAKTEYVVPQEAQSWADSFLRENIGAGKPVVVHPGATGDYKIWPPERFAALIDHLRDERVNVLLCYSTHDEPVVEEIRKHLKSPCPSTDTGDDLSKLAAILQRSSLCISNDSGPRHLAVAVGTPSLAIFRRHNEREWGVYRNELQASIIQGSAQCTVCPPEVCLDRLPPGQSFGCHCLREVLAETVIARCMTLIKLSS